MSGSNIPEMTPLQEVEMDKAWEAWQIEPDYRQAGFITKDAFVGGYAAGRASVEDELAALRETIASAPKLWIVLGADGETVIKSGSEVATKAWAESENDFLGVSKAYIAMPARLVLLDPKEQP